MSALATAFQSAIRGMIVVLFLGSCGGAAGATLRVAVVNPMDRVFLSTQVIDTESVEVELWAARNEYEPFQLAIRSDDAAAIDIKKVEATDLIDPKTGAIIPSAMFTYRFPALVYLQKHTDKTPADELDGEVPGWFPDPFEESRTLQFRGTRSIWGTWYVPANTKAGVYRGKLTIRSSAGTRTVSMQLHVWSFTIPKRPSIFVTNWLYISQLKKQYPRIRRDSEKFWNLIGEIANDMISHRQSVIFTPLELIHVWRYPDGTYTFDFEDYRKWVRLFLDYGFQAFEGSHLLRGPSLTYDIRKIDISKLPKKSGKAIKFGEPQLATREGQEFLESLLEALHRENVRLGIEDIYLQHVGDEASSAQTSLYRTIAKLVRKTMPGVPIIDATALSAQQRQGMMDIPVILMGYPEDNALGATARKWGRWWYTAVGPKGKFPNRFIDYPLLKIRMIPWLTWRRGLSGYLHYGYNWWHTSSRKSPWEDVDQSGRYPPGDGFIVYPARETSSGPPVSSLRWEIFREGLEDFEYLAALDRLIGVTPGKELPSPTSARNCRQLVDQSKNLLDRIRKSVADPQTYLRDVREHESLRLQVGTMLDRLSYC